MSKLHRDNAGYVGCSAEETQDPYYSFNKLALPLRGQINSVLREEVTFTVTVASAGGGNKYFINGVQQATVTLLQGYVYTFDQSDSSNGNHPLRFSYTADGTHGGGTEITLGVTKNGTPGQSGAYTRIVVPFGMHDLKYYCAHHSGMGGAASVTSNPNMTTYGLPILKTTDKFGKTLGSGNSFDPYGANLVLAVPMNGTNNSTTFTDVSASIRGSGSAKTLSVNGNAKVKTSPSSAYYYGSRGFFDGNGDRLQISTSTDLIFNGDFTIETWLNIDSSSSVSHPNGDRQIAGVWTGTDGDWQFNYASSGTHNLLQFLIYDGGTIVVDSAVNMSAYVGQNVHVAVTRKNKYIQIYLNGQAVGSPYQYAKSFGKTSNTAIGGRVGDDARSVNGFLTDFRIYQGVAKYTTPVPTGEYAFKAVKYDGNGGTQQIGGPVYSNSITGSFNSGAGQGADKAFNGTTSGTNYAAASNGSTAVFTNMGITGITKIRLSLAKNNTGNNWGNLILNDGTTNTNLQSWLQSNYSGRGNSASFIDVTSQFSASTLESISIDASGSVDVRIAGVEINDNVLLNGDGSNILFSPGLVWTKSTSELSNHAIYDTLRGTSKRLRSNEVNSEDTRSGVTSFDPNGFTEGNFDNQTNYEYVAWMWNAGNLVNNSQYLTQGQVWSTSFTSSNGFDTGAGPEKAFDGLTSTFSQPTGALNTSPGVLNASISNITSMRVMFKGRLHLNSGSELASEVNEGVWYTVSSPPSTLTKLEVYPYTHQAVGAKLYAVEINGKLVVDAGIVPAGLLNSTLYNQSTDWSSGANNSNMQNNWDTSFDGNMSNFALPNTGYASPTLTFSSAISYSTLELVVSRDIFAPDLLMNGSALNVPATDSNTTGGQYKIERLNFTNGTLTSIGHNSRNTAGRGGSGFWQIIVDGKILVNSSATPPNVPSIASKVQANPSYGFSIITATQAAQSGLGGSVGHGLGKEPAMYIVKDRDAGTAWGVYHQGLGTASKALQLNTNSDEVTTSGYFNNTAPTSSVLTVGAGVALESNDYVCYAWSEIPGFSKFGVFTGAPTVTVTTGFKPAFLLIKNTTTDGSWSIFDNARDPDGEINHRIYANETSLDGTNIVIGNFNATGFTLTNQGNTNWNTTGDTFAYMALAESSASDAVYEAVGTTKVIETDLSSSGHTITNNGATFQTAVSKFYDGAVRFDALSQYLTVSPTDDFKFGTGDFTVESWIYQTESNTYPTLIEIGNHLNTSGLVFLTGSPRVYSGGMFGGTLSPLDVWHHVAYCRKGGVLSIYIDGSQQSSHAFTNNLTDIAHVSIGRSQQFTTSSYRFPGYIQDLRVYKGIAKYTSSFSPPERSVQGTARRYPSGVYVVS